MTDSDILPVLLSGQQVSLASWFADPLTRRQARAWLPRIQHRLQNAVSTRQNAFTVRLAELIVRYWLGDDVAVAHRNMLATPSDSCEQAMLELCYGQLLMARKTETAWQHLDSGFQIAAHILKPEDYFIVLRRHERLRALVLSPRPTKPMRLNELLTEAGVIQRLNSSGQGTRRRAKGRSHQDTID